jgi:hypothetical protein
MKIRKDKKCIVSLHCKLSALEFNKKSTFQGQITQK